MNSTNGKLQNRTEEEFHVNQLVDEFLQNNDPQKMGNTAFRAARFNAGLAWIHFPKGEGDRKSVV